MIVAPAILAGSMAIPVERVRNYESLVKSQTHRYFPMGAEEPLYVRSYREEDGYIHVPRQFGLDYCRRQGIEYEDHTTGGEALSPPPKSPTPRPYQVEPLEELERLCEGYFDYVFRARTGWGKTVGALTLAFRLGKTTLVVVDQENLKDQWVDALVEHFGFDRKDIGVIQGKKLDYAGKPVTIAMMQTLAQKRLPPEVYDYFGFLIVDEVHVAGAPTFSSVLMDFAATHRLGVSATPKRRDGLQKLLDYNLGRVRLWIEDQHEPSSVRIIESYSTYSWYANISPKIGRFITEIAEDSQRNLLLAEQAIMLYDTGRDVLVIGDRVEQLQQLRDLCYYLGLPEEDLGLYTKQHGVYGYVKEPKPLRNPPGHVRKTEFTPVSLKLTSKTARKADLEQVKASARIIFATYGMFSKGVDVPRLAAGIDATPRGQAEQTHGRTLRELKGKKSTIWITVADVNSYRSLFTLAKRVADYDKNSGVLKYLNQDGTVTIWHPNDLRAHLFEEVERLKSLRIEKNSAGLNTLATPQQQMRQEVQRALTTGTATPPLRSSRMVSSQKASSVNSTTRILSTPPRSNPLPFLKRRKPSVAPR